MGEKVPQPSPELIKADRIRLAAALEKKVWNPDDDKAFQAVFKHVTGPRCRIDPAHIADELGISRSTIGRYITGRSQPAKLIRPKIFELLIELLRR